MVSRFSRPRPLWATAVLQMAAPLIGTAFYAVGIYFFWLIKNSREPILFFGKHYDFTKKTEPKGWVARYNQIWLVICLLTFVAITFSIASSFFGQSAVQLYTVFCDPDAQLFYRLRLQPIYWVFYLTKYYELFDTFFILLNQRSVTVLHVFQRLLALWVTWSAIQTRASYLWLYVMLNSFANTVVAYYLFKSARGFVPQWTGKLAKLQLAQFWINMMGLVLWFMLNRSTPDGAGCSGQEWAWFFTFGGHAVGFVLYQFAERGEAAILTMNPALELNLHP